MCSWFIDYKLQVKTSTVRILNQRQIKVMSRQGTIICLVALAMVFSVAGCGKFAKTTSQDVGIAASQDIGPLLEPIRAKYDLPAIAGAVILEGQTAAWGATGVRKINSDVKVTPNDKFHIGSCTKAMTATIIAMSVERGKLRWDLTLGEAFADMADEMHSAYREITLRHLLAHRAGLPGTGGSWPEDKTFMDMYDLPGTPSEQRLAYTRMMLCQKPEVAPGTKYLYSNAGYAIAGVMAERAMKKSWEKMMKEMLFKPLRMKTAGFGAMGRSGRIEQPWQHRMLDEKLCEIEPGPLSDNPPVIGPAGTVHCSIRDWAKFVEAQLKGARGKDGLLKAETFELLHTPDFGGNYTLGWVVTERDWAWGKVLRHRGSNSMNFAVVWMAPRRNFAVMVASNQGGGDVAKGCNEACWTLIQEYLLNKQAGKEGETLEQNS